jgi:hypothetical protein
MSQLTEAFQTLDQAEFDEILEEYEFDEEELEMIEEMARELDVELDQVNEISENGMIHIDQMYQNPEPTENFIKDGLTLRKVPEGVCMPGKKTYKDIYVPEFVPHESYAIQIIQGVVLLTINENAYKIGISKNKNLKFERAYPSIDLVHTAGKYNEEIGGRGTRMGYSVFVHLMAILAVVQSTDGVVEPDSGDDIEIESISIEVTGNNFEFRSTKSSVVINKYLIVGYLLSRSPVTELIIRSSKAEDSYDTSVYENTAIDQGISPYTSEISLLHDLIRTSTDQQYQGLSAMHLNWFSRKDHPTENIFVEATNSESIDLIFSKSGKRSGKFPCPFKILYPKFVELTHDQVLNRKRQVVRVMDYIENTSFHTLDPDDDPTEYLYYKTGNLPKDFASPSENFEEMFRKKNLEISTYQAIEIESELLSKINSNKGHFWSAHSRCGISWIKRSSDLMYNCVFYTFDEPINNDKIIGEWRFKDGIYRSPVFKVSLSYIRFSEVLPNRVLNSYLACHTLTSDKIFREMGKSLCTLFSLWRWSSWETTRYAANSRYITTCHLNKSGDIQNLIDKQSENSRANKIRYADYLYLWLLKKYIIEDKDYSRTPLLGLSFQFLSLEKDVTLGMSWHMRESNHATACMTKVLKALKLERETRIERLNYLRTQKEFLTRMQESGVSQTDYDLLMSIRPKFPHFNAVYFMAITKLCENDLATTGQSQEATDFSITNIISGSHNLDVLTDEKFKNSKVYKTLNKLPKSEGIHEMLAKQLLGKKIRNIHSVHPKDGKSSDRDIEQMHIELRPWQLARESMMSITSKTTEFDHMKDKNKHVSFVKKFQSILNSKKPRAVTSEDRTFHSGYNYPEEMSLAYLIIAKIVRSTSIVFASSLQRQNKSRELIFPEKYDYNSDLARIDLDGTELSFVSKINGNKIHKCAVIKTFAHFLQGIDVIGASAINTIKTTADLNTARQIFRGVKRFVGAVTSDDAAKGVEFESRTPNSNMIATMKSGLEELDCVMMENNDKKFSLTERSVEINNIQISQTGMVTQSPIHSVLTNNPLMSADIIGDIMDVVSDSRSVIFWGDSPTVALSALNGGVLSLRRKWLFTEEEIDRLKNQFQLIPRDLEELISGFFPRNKLTFSLFIDEYKEDEIQDVQRGIISPFSGLRSKFTTRKSKIKFKNDTTNLPRAARIKSSKIIEEQSQGGRINQSWARILPLQKRIQIKEDFLKHLDREPKKIYNELFELLKPYDVQLHLKPLQRRDSIPRMMGTSSTIHRTELSRIKCKMIFGFNVNNSVPFAMPNGTLEEIEESYNRVSQKLGLSFVSPSGLPLIKYLGTTYFRSAHVFNFSIILPKIDEKDDSDKFIFRGVPVLDFKVSMWSTATLRRVKGNKFINFGTGSIGNNHYAFFKKRNEQVSCELVPKKPGLHELLDSVALVGKDFSPLIPSEFGVRYSADFPGITGDPVAIYNYHGYSHSNLDKPVSTYRAIMRSFNSDIPGHVTKYLPNFPIIPVDEEISGYGNYNLIGFTCINKLNLKFLEGGTGHGDVDLRDVKPMLIDRLTDAIEEDITYED